MREDIEEISAIEGGDSRKNGTGGLMFVTISALVMAVAITVLGYMVQEGSDALQLNAWTVFLGDLHPVVLHLPVGIFILVFLMELGGLLSFGKWKPQTAFALFIGVVSAVVAVIFGCLLFQQGDQPLDEAIWHLWGSIAFTIVATLAFVAKIWANHYRSRSPMYGILLVMSIGLLVWSSHGGGVMTHGTDPIDSLKAALKVDDSAEAVVPEIAYKAPEDRLVYEEIIVPIFHGKCYECHADAELNPLGKKKIKGGLVMTDMESLIKGGSSEIPAIVPGDLEASYIHETINLPMDDDMHMPPENKDQLEFHEIAIIDWWIADGAKTGVALKDTEAPEEIVEAVSKLVPPEELLKQQAEAAAAAEAEQAAEEAQRAKFAKAVEEVGEDFPNALRYLSQESSDLTFTAVSMRDKFGDEDLEKLIPVGGAIVELEVGSTGVTDSGVLHLAEMPRLQRLKLNDTGVTDASLDVVGQLLDLTYLNLVGTAVTDEGIMKLEGLTNLEKLYLWQSQVTKEGAASLQEKLPDVEINLGIE